MEADSAALARKQDSRMRETEEREAERARLEIDRVIREEEDGQRKKDEEEQREEDKTRRKLLEDDGDLLAELEQDLILGEVTLGGDPLDCYKSANSETNSIAKEHAPELISDRYNSIKSDSQSSTLSLPEISGIDLANIHPEELYDGPELTSNFVMNALNHDVYDEGVHARLQVLNVVIEENGYQLEINDGVSKVWNVLVQDKKKLKK